jgi:hypothetical protein
MTARKKIFLKDGRQNKGRCFLQNLVADCWNTKRPQLAVTLRNVTPANKLRLATISFKVFYHVSDILFKIGFIGPVVYSIHSRCRVLVQLREAPFQVTFVQQAEQIPESVLWKGFRSLCYSTQ